MKRQRSILSSGSSSDETILTMRKEAKMTNMNVTPHEENPVEDVTLKDAFVQLNSMRREMDSSFTMVNRNMEEMRHELRHDMKKLNEEIQEVKRSLDNAWLEIEDSKSNMAKASEDIVIMKAEISFLKDQLKVEREKNVKLEQCTRRENLRILNVLETEEEDTEQLFTQILTKMGIIVQNMNFHAIHRVGPPKDQAKYRRHDKPLSPRHII